MSFAMARAKQGGARIAQLFLLLALVWQGAVVQSHAHYTRTVGPIAAVATSANTRTADAQTLSAPCLLCEEQALFGALVLSAPPVIAAPTALPAWYQPGVRLYSAAPQSSHSWQSRAPPSFS